MDHSFRFEVETAALQLSERERAALAARLIESLDPAIDDDAEASWGEEVKQRLAQIERREVRMIPWDVARRMIQEGTHRGGSAGTSS